MIQRFSVFSSPQMAHHNLRDDVGKYCDTCRRSRISCRECCKYHNVPERDYHFKGGHGIRIIDDNVTTVPIHNPWDNTWVPYIWLWAIFQFLLASAGIFLNGLVLVVTISDSEIRSFFNILLANLALACLGSNLFVTLVHVIATLLDFYILAEIKSWYQFYMHINTFFHLTINVSVCSLCVNRLVAVLYPEYYSAATRSRISLFKVIAPIWTCAMLGSLAAGFAQMDVPMSFTLPLNPCRHRPVPVKAVSTFLDTIFMMAPTVIITLCFFNIGVKLYLVTPKVYPHLQRSFPRRLQCENESALKKRHVKNSRSMFACAVTWVLVTYPPTLLCWRAQRYHDSPSDMVQLWMTVLKPIGTILYPIWYGWCNRTLRTAFRWTLGCSNLSVANMKLTPMGAMENDSTMRF
ncbi:hypothetical protein BV898_08497 [Hypsibius exemplaris]|uniref:G-protein coupled receptors family 1 profile domain-containing protein n=1 Tax=Hypsibius exemplaris TaxID=2072580 RepID=A0A1W0WQC2_HYPEX|nr:hypothetical protein BV898_08497 [Hypsibius exemplaris]